MPGRSVIVRKPARVSRAHQPGWRADTGGTRLVALYERPSGGRVSAALAGATRGGRPVLDLVRLDSAKSLPAPRALDATWRGFLPSLVWPIRSAPAVLLGATASSVAR
jgi:hypothetical protein